MQTAERQSISDLDRNRLLKHRHRAAHEIMRLSGTRRHRSSLRMWCLILADLDEELGWPERRTFAELVSTFDYANPPVLEDS